MAFKTSITYTSNINGKWFMLLSIAINRCTMLMCVEYTSEMSLVIKRLMVTLALMSELLVVSQRFTTKEEMLDDHARV